MKQCFITESSNSFFELFGVCRSFDMMIDHNSSHRPDDGYGAGLRNVGVYVHHVTRQSAREDCTKFCRHRKNIKVCRRYYLTQQQDASFLNCSCKGQSPLLLCYGCLLYGN